MASDDVACNIAAAAIAGCVQPLIFNPLDVLRIRFQVAGPSAPASTIAFARSIIVREGLLNGLYLVGLRWNCLAVSLSQGLRMGLYPSVRNTVVGTDSLRPDLMALSGLLSGSVGYLISSPLFLLKVRAQASAETGTWPPSPRSIGGYWLGCTPMVARGALLTAGQMGGYDASKRIGRRMGIRDGPMLVACAACAAGLSAATLSAPADVVTTHMQSRAAAHAAPSISGSAREILKAGGLRGLFRGWSVSVARLVPTFVVGSTIYEQSRRALGLAYL